MALERRARHGRIVDRRVAHEGFGEARRDESGCDRVRAHARAAEFARKHLREHDQPRLAHAVGAESGRRVESADRRHVHDRTGDARLAKDPRRHLAGDERTLQVHVEDLVPGRLLQVDDRHHDRIRPGVVHQHVEPAEQARALGDHRADLRGAPDVAGDHEGASADRLDLAGDLVEALAASRDECQVGARLGHRERDLAADAARGTGHDRAFPVEAESAHRRGGRAHAGVLLAHRGLLHRCSSSMRPRIPASAA